MMKQKILWLAALIIACLVLVAVPLLAKKPPQTQVVQQVAVQIFTCPNEALFAMLDAPNPGGATLGQGVPSGAQGTPSLLDQQFQKMYGSFFTQEAYSSFVNQRLPLQFLLLARKQSCTVSIQAFQATERADTPGTYSWTATLAVQAPGAEAQTVVQDGLAVFAQPDGEQLVHFALTGDALQRVLLGIGA